MALVVTGKPQFAVKTSSDPAAGSEHAYTADEDVLVRKFHVALVTDANVANRQVEFTFEDAQGNVYARFVAGGTQAASLTRFYFGIEGDFASPAVANDVFQIPLGKEGIFLPKGGKIKTVIGGAPVTQRYADEIGANGYSPDAASAVEKTKEVLGIAV